MSQTTTETRLTGNEFEAEVYWKFGDEPDNELYPDANVRKSPTLMEQVAEYYGIETDDPASLETIRAVSDIEEIQPYSEERIGYVVDEDGEPPVFVPEEHAVIDQ